MTQSKNIRRFFTEQEDAILIELWKKKWKSAEIGKFLNRAPNSILSRVDKHVKSGALDPRKPTDLARMRASAPVDDDAPETKSEKVPSEERGTRALRLMENGTPVWKIASLLGFTSFEVAVLTGTDLPRGPYSDLAFANVGHLIDLKRSGHSPTRTEYDIPPEDQTRRFVPASPVASYVGSPAAICSDSW